MATTNVTNTVRINPAKLVGDLLGQIGLSTDSNDPFTKAINSSFLNVNIKQNYNPTVKDSFASGIKDLGGKINAIRQKIDNIPGQELKLGFQTMVINLIKVQIYSYYEKIESAQRESGEKPAIDQNTLLDIIKLVNQSLDQSNKVFEDRLIQKGGQSGGRSVDSKIEVMSKYFDYKLKYTMLKYTM